MNEYSFDFAGSRLTWEYKKFAILSNSAVFAKWGKTAVLVSVLRGPAQTGSNFFPLQVEYIEKLYASGKIMSSPYVKREGFASEEATLRGRIIDRAIRPRFPKELLDQVQIYITVLSYDPEFDPMLLAFNTTVAALMTSDIPFEGEVSGIRVSMDKEEKLFVNPKDVTSLSYLTAGNMEKMNIVLGLTKEGVLMFDADMDQLPEEKVKEALEFGRVNSQVMWDAQKEFAKQINIEKKAGTMLVVSEEMVAKVDADYGKELDEALSNSSKEYRKTKLEEIAKKVTEEFKDKEGFIDYQVTEAIDKVSKKYIRKSVLEKDHRIDGRAFDEIRTLSAEVGLLDKVHGSGLFKRGDTHVLTIATLGSPAKHQVMEDMTGEDNAYYVHHYSSPPFGYGEVGRFNAKPGRREIGHGALAEKAVARVVPSQEEFPYMIRLVSEIMSSAGSTSMASTCGSTLALMDAGVPISAPVGGISVGVIADDNFEKYHLLVDIEEIEDFFGEMDFKVAGTSKGITAIQMDEKRLFIPYKVINEAIDAAKKAREQVLSVLNSAISAPRTTLAESAPQIERVNVDPEKIGKIIGPGGKTIKEITRLSGVDLNISDDGVVEIFGSPASARQIAKDMIEALFEDFKIGEIYDGKILENRPFGAICLIARGSLEGKGLIHVSELADGFVKDPNEIVKPGQNVRVKVVGIDDMGRLKLSLKQAVEKK